MVISKASVNGVSVSGESGESGVSGVISILSRKMN